MPHPQRLKGHLREGGGKNSKPENGRCAAQGQEVHSARRGRGGCVCSARPGGAQRKEGGAGVGEGAQHKGGGRLRSARTRGGGEMDCVAQGRPLNVLLALMNSPQLWLSVGDP